MRAVLLRNTHHEGAAPLLFGRGSRYDAVILGVVIELVVEPISFGLKLRMVSFIFCRASVVRAIMLCLHSTWYATQLARPGVFAGCSCELLLGVWGRSQPPLLQGWTCDRTCVRTQG